MTACWSVRMPAAKECRQGWSSASTAVSQLLVLAVALAADVFADHLGGRHAGRHAGHDARHDRVDVRGQDPGQAPLLHLRRLSGRDGPFSIRQFAHESSFPPSAEQRGQRHTNVISEVPPDQSCLATSVPQPWRPTASPSAFRTFSALAAVVLAQSYSCARRVMDGSASPGRNSPRSILARKSAAIRR